ncbi:MAG: tRNA (adenine-N1)-methyltransferase [Trueperella sp.]|nr:tRNA (adenine-N1)-methyltransferase [Trueperella sp.]
MGQKNLHPLGAQRRRGPFRPGERVQLTDAKNRKYTITLTTDGYFHSTRLRIAHREIIGKPEGTVLATETGHEVQLMRPLLADYVLSMPRGATVVYPKDAGQIVMQADVFPGAKVVEAGLGSGALALSLLSAIGEQGQLTSVEIRPEFAEIAQGNVYSWFGTEELPWKVEIGAVADVLYAQEPHSIDTVIFDMLAPWENIAPAAHALRPGGVILAYVTTTTQMSRFVEELRQAEVFSEPEAGESFVRTWHLEGLAVRPDHRMVAHTGFLVVARRLAPESQPLRRKIRPAPAAYNEPYAWQEEAAPISERKLRKVRRDVARRADQETSGLSTPGQRSAELDAELQAHGTQKAALQRLTKDDVSAEKEQ